MFEVIHYMYGRYAKKTKIACCHATTNSGSVLKNIIFRKRTFNINEIINISLHMCFRIIKLGKGIGRPVEKIN